MYTSLNGATAGGGLPIDQFVQLAKDAGFDAADVDVSYGTKHSADALAEVYASRGMRYGGWNAPDWRSDEAKWKSGLDGFKTAADVAGKLGIDSCITWIMPSSALPLMENWKFHVTRLQPVAQILADRGLRLGLEFVAPTHIRVMNAHEFLFTPGQMLELAAAVGPNVGLLIDSYHLHAAGDTAARIRTIPGEKIVLVHLNDARPIPVPSLQDGDRLLPGEGVIGIPMFLQALKAQGYSGPVSVEVFSAELKKMPAADAARKAAVATRQAFAAAGL